ncbi:nuclear transport factor 2 family protein [Shewanella sp. SR44-3]|nr:nuclear transport factor 2 family protein [Shewanella sp. SR44-3]
MTNVHANEQDNLDINQYYQKFTVSFSNLDLNAIDELYTHNAVYISETHNREIVQGKSDIIDLYQSFFDRIRRKQAKIEVEFRVHIRQRSDNTATDIGYYLVRFHPAKDAGEPVSEFSGKFVNVFIKEHNKWRISVDSNTRGDASLYFAAKPQTSLYYGQRFKASEHKKLPKPDNPR